jgi:tRNA 2-selenouridine synthase
MIKAINTPELLKLRSQYSLIDVRSPAEYSKAHIPGAVNIPIFSDTERADVGTRYKQIGRENAIAAGLEYAALHAEEYLQRAADVSHQKPLLVYCWRGGMRSLAFCQLLKSAGISSFRLHDGYKAYKNFLRQEFKREIKLIILGGMTGSGKTEKLLEMQKMGEQVIDLEGLANHKGSAFGYSPDLPQPSNEHFENLLYEEWRKLDFQKVLWLEDESRMIGRVQINDHLFKRMRLATVIKIEVNTEDRVRRLVKDYTDVEKEFLLSAFQRISKRLGGLNYQKAAAALSENDFATAAQIALRYYDKAYLYGLAKRQDNKIVSLQLASDKPKLAAEEIIKFAKDRMKLFSLV